ncbi:hypothetical protein DTO207G8_3809 [Paecilomyces variotii]|nr:hypothetical protein DTO207G8_3809 [Paecilomyces variotii]
MILRDFIFKYQYFILPTAFQVLPGYRSVIPSNQWHFLEGNPVDGRTCNAIYEDDDPHSELRLILDEEGNVVDMYMGDPEAGLWTREAVKSSNSDAVTVDPTTVTVTTGVAARSESRPTVIFPASTIGQQTGGRLASYGIVYPSSALVPPFP